MTIVSHGICLWWLAVLWTFSNVFPRPFDDWKNMLLYVGGGIIISIVSASERPLTPTLSRGERVVLLLYFTICIASILLSPTAHYEGWLALARLMIWAGLVWVFSQMSEIIWRRIMQFTVLSAAAVAILTWMQMQGFKILPYGDSWSWLAPIGHLSYYGDFMALAIPMAACLSATSKGWVRPIFLLALFLAGLGLWLSATRASILGTIVAAGVVLVASIRYRMVKPRWIAGGVVAVIVMGLALWHFEVPTRRSISPVHRLADILDFNTDIEKGSGGRWHTYVTSARIIRERPFMGWGLGSFRFVYPEYAHIEAADTSVSSTTWYMHPHNEILHQTMETGPLSAALFLLGIGYLLYRGAQGIRRSQDARERALLLMAMAGIVTSFVSWQFSTNFLFPVSRLMTAFFAAIIMSSVPHALPLRGRMAAGQERGKFTWIPRTTPSLVILSTLLLGAYQLSLYFVQKHQTARTADDAQRYAAWAVRLAPGAFDPLYVRAAATLKTQPPDQAAPAVEQLVRHYPYVPAALSMMGYVRAWQGRFPEARDYLRHSISNDPHNTNSSSKQLLDQLTPPH